MQILILLAVLALLILGPRRGGRMPGPIAIGVACDPCRDSRPPPEWALGALRDGYVTRC